MMSKNLGMFTGILGAMVVVLLGCGKMVTNEELTIRKMLEEFIHAVQENDEGLAQEYLLDLKSFTLLSPDVAARVDAETFIDAVLTDLLTNYRNLVRFFGGRNLKVKKFILGDPWYQYKGFPAFKNNVLVVRAGNEDVQLVIRGIVKVGDRWRIVDLSDTGLF
ncbi:MAG: hypothetical protein ACK4OO_04035 [bacterium]